MLISMSHYLLEPAIHSPAISLAWTTVCLPLCMPPCFSTSLSKRISRLNI